MVKVITESHKKLNKYCWLILKAKSFGKSYRTLTTGFYPWLEEFY